MADNHWFDTLNTLLVREAPRRTISRAAARFVAGLALGAAPTAGAARKREKKKRKRTKPRPSEGSFDCCGPGESCTDAVCTSTP